MVGKLFVFSVRDPHSSGFRNVSSISERGMPTHKLSAGPTAFAEFTLCVAIAIAVACVFSLATERQTDVLRRWLLNRSTKITDAAAPRLIQQP
jgi:hypothetical protein